MNREILKNYINAYKTNFDIVNQMEIYKWKAVKCFQDNWDIDAEDFHEMLMSSIKLTENLLKSGQYFPLRMLMKYTKQFPNETRTLFKDLYNEDEDLKERITNFQNGLEEINNILYQGKQSYQDPRAVVVYLTLRYPERYFFYKFKMFKNISKKLEIQYKPIAGRMENIGQYNNTCQLIRYELSQDQKLLKMHKNRITQDCYYDENLNILTQDFIYAIAEHLAPTDSISVPLEIETITELVGSAKLNNLKSGVNFKGRIVNFTLNNIENKRIGDLGENWVVKYEINRLVKAGKRKLSTEVKHVSIEEGDGTGYDVESFDVNGNKIYIEVKTTRGRQDSTFFISNNELERSKLEQENYYLYRVYDFNEESGIANLLIIKGELSNLCEFPTTYKISLAKNKIHN